MSMKKVVEFFREILEIKVQVHYSKLVSQLQCSNCSEKFFFDTCTDHFIRSFFKYNPVCKYEMTDDGLVSLADRQKICNASHAQSSNISGKIKSNGKKRVPDCMKPKKSSDSNSSKEQAVAEALISRLLQHGSMYYLDLIKLSGKKTKGCVHKYFKNFSTSEKLEFFKSHTNKFTIDDFGYVTLGVSGPEIPQSEKPTEAAVVDYFTFVLRKTNGIPLELFVKYLQSIALSINNYFDPFSLSNIHQFLKTHHTRFVVDRYSFVSLRVNNDVAENKEPTDKAEVNKGSYTDYAGATDTCDAIEFHNLGIINSYVEDTTKRIEGDKSNPETVLLKSLSSTLLSYGPMNFLALAKCSAGKQYINCFQKLNPMEKFMFLENHSNTFTIKNDGYVSLCKISDNRLREDKLVNYFISILRTAYRMSCAKLVKHLKNSNLDAKTHFVPINFTNLMKFFTEHHACFVVEHGSFISLKTEEEQISGMVQTTDCVTKLSEEIKGRISKTCRECDTDILLVEKSSERKGKQISKTCHEYDTTELLNRYISSTCMLSASSAERIVVETFVSILLKYGSMYYMTLIVLATRNSIFVQEYLRNFNKAEKHEFFKCHANTFNIDNYGYVTLSGLAFEQFEEKAKLEDEVVDYFTSVLKTTRALHYMTLVRLLRNSDLDVRNYFDGCSDSEIREFFMKHSVRFSLQSPYFVPLCKGIAEAVTQGGYDDGAKVFPLRKGKDDGTKPSRFLLDHGIYVSLQENFEELSALNDTSNCVQEFGKLEKIKLSSEESIYETKISTFLDPYAGSSGTTEETIVEMLLSTLSKHGPMHYLTLIWAELRNENAFKYFENISSLKKLMFFKKHSNSFIIADDGYVAPNVLALENLKFKQAVEETIISYFSQVLKSAYSMHYYELIKCLQHSNLKVKNYFDFYSDSELYWFFKSRPLQFLVADDSYVSLQTEERTILEKKSLARLDEVVNFLESKGSGICKFKVLSGSEKNQTQLPTASGWDTSTESHVHNKSELMYTINKTILTSASSSSESICKAAGKTRRTQVNSEKSVISRSTSKSATDAQSRMISHVLPTNAVFPIEDKSVTNTVDLPTMKKLDPSQGNGLLHSNNGTAELCESGIPTTSSHPVEEELIETLIAILMRNKLMHYIYLIETAAKSNINVQEYFSRFSSMQKFNFFEKHPNTFDVYNDGYVTISSLAFERLTKEAEEDNKHGAYFISKSLQEILEIKKVNEDEIIRYFTSILKITGTKHYLGLIKYLQYSNSWLKNYFDTYYNSELRWFFKSRPSYFAMDRNSHVSLRTEKRAISTEEAAFMQPEKQQMH